MTGSRRPTDDKEPSYGASSLVSAEWLADNLADPRLRIVDVRYFVNWDPDGTYRGSRAGADEAYAQGHIPKAVHIDLAKDLSDPKAELRLTVIEEPEFEMAMARFGIGNDTIVVAYDDEFGQWAGRLWWILKYYGHELVKVLDGGLRAWIGLGYPLEAGSVSVAPAAYKARRNTTLRVTASEVLASLNQPHTTIVDALPSNIFSGEARLYPTHRAGHIPGAKNVPAPSNVNPETGRFLDPAQLAALWSKVDLPPESRVIVYCGAGVFSTVDLLALEILGHKDVALYDNSWQEWGARLDLPVELGTNDDS